MKAWDKKAYIKASAYREKVYELLKKGPCTPKELSKNTNIKFSHISRTLAELQEKGIVKCLTSKEIRKNKIYALK